MAGEPKRSPLQEKLDARMQARIAEAEGPAAAAAPAEWAGRTNLFGEPYQGGLFGRGGTLGLGLGSDPWETTMTRTVTPSLPESVRGASKYVLPQNAPELAVQALTLGSPVGRLVGKGTMAAMPAVKGVLARAGVKALESGAGAGLTGAFTGHDPASSTIGGVVGGAAGQLAGEGAGALAQTATAKRMVDAVNQRVQGAVRSIFGDVAVPAGESAASSLQRVINGDVVTEVQKDIGTLIGRKYFGTAPGGFETDAKVLALARDAAKQGLDIWKTKGVPSMGKMWAQLPAARDELARFLAPRDLVAYGTERAKLEAAELTQNLFLNGRTPVEATKALLDKGALTAKGLAELQSRYGALTQQELAKLGPAASELGEALYQGAGRGARVGVEGELPKAHIPSLLHPIPTVELNSGRLPWQPGWEEAAGTVASSFVPGAGPKGALTAGAAQGVAAHPVGVTGSDFATSVRVRMAVTPGTVVST